MATGKQDLCNQLIQRLDQLEIEAGCRDKKFTEKDTVDQIFSCPIRVQQANPELVSRIESNGCSQPGWKLVFRSDRNHPGQFWEWRTLNNETQVSHFFEYSVFASLLVIIFFISINLWSREANPGWKRLSIVLCALATILSTWYATTEFGGLDRNIEIPLFTAILLHPEKKHSLGLHRTRMDLPNRSLGLPLLLPKASAFRYGNKSPL